MQKIRFIDFVELWRDFQEREKERIEPSWKEKARR